MAASAEVNFAPNRDCYHEAGHAVAWIINGDTVLLVVADSHIPLTEQQQQLSRQLSAIRVVPWQPQPITKGNGYTVAQVGHHACPCGGAINPDTGNPLVARFHINVECSGCIQILTNHLACITAGGAATGLLQSGASTVDLLNNAFQTRREMNHDRREIDRILSGLVSNREQSQEIKERAEQLAEIWMRTEANAVATLADALRRIGVMDGSDATRLVRENSTRKSTKDAHWKSDGAK